MMMAVELKMKKKRILAFTACLLAAMLCACSREPAGQTLTGQTPAGTEEAAPQESAAGNAETASPEPETETLTVLEGTLNGWADNHTVEIMVDGAPAAFQVEDEDVKAALEAVGEEASFFFEVQQDGEVRRIVGVMLE